MFLTDYSKVELSDIVLSNNDKIVKLFYIIKLIYHILVLFVKTC